LLRIRRSEVGLLCGVVREDKRLIYWRRCRGRIVVGATGATGGRRVLLFVRLLWRKGSVLVGRGVGGEWGLAAKDLLLGAIVPLAFYWVYLFLSHWR
jgi:hypothetical protein